MVARTLAQQFAKSLTDACRPHQYAIGSRVGPTGPRAARSPFGTPEFVHAHLQHTLHRQTALLDQFPKLQDTQVAWLLLSCCASPRAQYALRTLPTNSTARHDAATQEFLSWDADRQVHEVLQAEGSATRWCTRSRPARSRGGPALMSQFRSYLCPKMGLVLMRGPRQMHCPAPHQNAAFAQRRMASESG